MNYDVASSGMEPYVDRHRPSTLVSKYVGLSIVLLAASFLVTQFPDEISRPLARWLNSLSGRNSTFDRICLNFALYPTFSGVLLCGILFAHWIKDASIVNKAEILIGVCVSFCAGILSRYLQHHLPTHIRPYYDSGVGFRPLPGVDIPPLNTWNSFPSDHVAVFGGLVVTLFVIRAWERYWIALWIILVESSRAFIGAHFPSDLVGGAALGSTVVWSFQHRPFIRLGEWICGWERRAPVLFYTVFFMFLYQVSTLFIEVRNMVGGFDAFKAPGS